MNICMPTHNAATVDCRHRPPASHVFEFSTNKFESLSPVQLGRSRRKAAAEKKIIILMHYRREMSERVEIAFGVRPNAVAHILVHIKIKCQFFTSNLSKR